MDIKDLKQTKKALEDIKSLQNDITKNTARYNKEGELGVKAARELNNLKATEAALLQKISKYDDNTKIKKEQAKIARTTVGLTAKLNKLLESGAGQILKQYNLTESLEAANKGAQISKGEEQKGYNLVQEAQAAAVQEMKDGTFKSAEFLNNLEEQFEGMSEEAQKAFKEMGPSLKDFAKEGEKAGKNLENALNIDAKSLDGLEEMRDKAKKISGILSSKKLMGAAALGLAVKFATDFASKTLEIRQSLGTSAFESARIAGNMKAAGAAAKVFGGSVQEAEAAIMGMTEEFGNLNLITAGTSIELGKMVANTGLTGANAAKLLKSLDSMSTASIETNIALISSAKELAKAAGVAPAQVLNDVASDTEIFAKFGKEGGKNLFEAAIAARKLGLNLSTVAGIAESLLDFESSITKEMEAEVVLQKSLNLDKAREFALAGNLEGVQAEILKNVGSEAEFAQMNVKAKEKLAAALGTSVSDLGKMVAGEKTSARLAEEKVEQETQMMDMAMVMNKMAVAKMTIEATILGYKAISLGLDKLQAMSSKKDAKADIVGGGAEIAKSISKIPVIGGVLGAIAAFGFISKMSGLIGFADGGMVGADGGMPSSTDTIPAALTPGEVVLNAAQQTNVADSIGGGAGGGAMIDNTALIKTTNQLLTKVNQGINTLIRKTGEQALTS
tara:strand:+ start:192 stop:2213 length:2022 start_codon:yes stop_codon:yes gene_type:complete